MACPLETVEIERLGGRDSLERGSRDDFRAIFGFGHIEEVGLNLDMTMNLCQ